MLVCLELYEFLSKIWCTEVLVCIFLKYGWDVCMYSVMCIIGQLDLLMPIKFYLLISGLCVLFV